MKDSRWKYSPWNDPFSTSRDSLNGVALSAPGRRAAPYCSASWFHMLLLCSPSTVFTVPPCPHIKHRTHTEYVSTSKELRMEAEDLTGKGIVWCLILSMRKGKRGKVGSTGPCSGREVMWVWGRGSGCASIPDFTEDDGAGLEDMKTAWPSVPSTLTFGEFQWEETLQSEQIGRKKVLV